MNRTHGQADEVVTRPADELYAAGGEVVGISAHGDDGNLTGNGLVGACRPGSPAGIEVGRTT